MLYLDSKENKEIRELRKLLNYLNLNIKDDFGVNVADDEVIGIENIHDALFNFGMLEHKDYSIFRGMTKLVVNFAKFNYVLKIPFNCYEDIDYTCFSDDDEEDEVAMTTCKFSNANKHYEWVDIENTWDYCELESKLYEYAIEENVEQFFLPVILLGKTKGNYPIYIQEKAKMWLSSPSPFESLYFNSFRTYCTEMCNTLDYNLFDCLPYEWAAYLYNSSSINKIYNFLYFIINLTSINADLHDANVGFTQEGRPVIIDYGSFSD